MQPVEPTARGTKPGTPQVQWDGGLAARMVAGKTRPSNVLLSVIAERIRHAADHLQIPERELVEIFEPHTVFEGETAPWPADGRQGFIIVETHHALEGMVGKGALKIVYPGDLLGEGEQYRTAGHGVIEVLRPDGRAAWDGPAEPEEVVRQTMRELMTGESLSMSLKCQATGAPFTGSEGLILCAERHFDRESGRFFLRPVLRGGDENTARDKECIEFLMNSTAEVLTRAGRIGYDEIVHAAETNSTLTARLGLQLPANVVEGHLRALLQQDANIIIGDEDMTPRLRQLLADPGYHPTSCALAKAAASMQMDHAILLPDSRQRLRELLADLPARGSPSPAQYRSIIDLFFGSGPVQRQESSLFHHREPLLRPLAVALSTQCLDECDDADVLSLYLRTLLDNQRVMLQALLMRKLPAGQSLPLDWFQRSAPLSETQEEQLRALAPSAPISKEAVAQRFLSAAEILFEAMGRVTENDGDPYASATRELLQLAIRAISSTGEVIPPVDRIVFFTLPFIYECVTPRLGVITRKPTEICGSELRPEAMAFGALFSIEILLQKFTRKPEPFAGLRVAVEGLGNAGKNLVRILDSKGAVIVAVSDSKGALVNPDGFSREELSLLLAHKDAGKRFDTLVFGPPAPATPASREGKAQFHPDPAALKDVEADLLVLTAKPGSIDEETAGRLRVKIVCELTGAAVTSAAKQLLKARHIDVVPDNLASSGGMLVSLSEMLQNSAGQVWERQMEERNLREQIASSYDAVIRVAGHYNIDLPTASDMLALRRMQELALYRKHLSQHAAALADRIRQAHPDEGVLFVIDDDEDGAASAAILLRFFEQLNPEAGRRVAFLSESLRSDAVLTYIQKRSEAGAPVRHVFVLDRAYPLTPFGQQVVASLSAVCRVTFVNNHDLPSELVEPRLPSAFAPAEGTRHRPADLGILLISPQTLRSTIRSRQFPTALILLELAHALFPKDTAREQLNWQAAVGSCLDVGEMNSGPWVLFYAQFSPDKILEAAQALRTMARVGGFVTAIEALSGVTRPDLLETNETWEVFLAAHKRLEERVQVLVEKIILENRRQPLTVHFFTPDETAVPAALCEGGWHQLSLYHWISERLTCYGDLGDKPIIVGQEIRAQGSSTLLGVRIRSPRGVQLLKLGLPAAFESGGLPNTAVARIPLSPGRCVKAVFNQLVEEVWGKLKPKEDLVSGSKKEK